LPAGKKCFGRKKLPYETIPVDLRKKEQKNPELLKLNPRGKVPVIHRRENGS